MATEVNIERAIEDRLRSLRDRGYIRAFRISHAVYRDALELDVELRTGECRRYDLTRLEIVNSDAAHWLDAVEEDIRSRAQSPGPQEMWRRQHAEIEMRRRYEPNMLSQQAINHWQHQWYGVDYASPPRDEKAEQRSKDLFVAVAGKEAFDMLEAGKPLPTTGSAGTAYTLHKRASYCVERVSDNAKLCAVVPGVPLWDHLLGIKLMVEHDEPKFLETANVAQSVGLSMQEAYARIARDNSQRLGQNLADNNALLQQLRQYRPPMVRPESIIGIDTTS